MDVRLDVAGVPRQGVFELRQRPLLVPQQGKGKPEEVVRVRKTAPRLDQVLEQVDGAVVVLHGKALARLREQKVRTGLHAPVGATEQTGRGHPQNLHGGGSRGYGRPFRCPPPSGGRRPAASGPTGQGAPPRAPG